MRGVEVEVLMIHPHLPRAAAQEGLEADQTEVVGMQVQMQQLPIQVAGVAVQEGSPEGQREILVAAQAAPALSFSSGTSL